MRSLSPFVLPLAFLLPFPLAGEEVLLTCEVLQIAATTTKSAEDKKLKKVMKYLAKEEALKQYQGFRFAGKNSLTASKKNSGSVKLKNGERLSLQVVTVSRAQRKNTVTVDLKLGDTSSRKSFIDHEYLFLPAGKLDQKSDLVVALHCPIFP